MSDELVPQSAILPSVNYAVYTAGNLANGMYTLVPSILLMFYMTNILGIPVALAATAAFIPKIIELISIAIFAGLSDRTRARLGRRRPYLLAGALSALPAFGVIWLSPFSDPAKSAYFILVTSSICTFVFPAFVVAFFALNAELPRDYHDRTRLNSFRTAYNYSGAILGTVGAPLLVQWAGGGRMGYRYMGFVVGACMAAASLVTFLAAREPPRPKSKMVPTLQETFNAMRGNTPYLLLFSTYVIYIASAAILYTFLVYFVTNILGRAASFVSLLYFVQFGIAVISVPLWVWMSRRLGKLTTLQLNLALILVSFLMYSVIDTKTLVWVILANDCVFGVNAAGVQVIGFSMLADCIQHGNEKASAHESSGMFTGIFLAGEKLGLAAGPLLAGLVLAATGFVETTHGSVVQPQSALTGIRFALSFIPAVLNAIAILILFFYRPFERKMVARHTLQQVVSSPRPSAIDAVQHG